MRYLYSSYSIALFVLGSYLISWQIWFYAGQFHNVFHIRIGSWGIDIPLGPIIGLLGNIGPGLSATAVVGLTQGWTNVRQLWSGLRGPRLSGAWILFVCLLIPGLFSIALLVHRLLGGKVVATGNPIRWFLLIVVNLPFAPLWEEIGWRGFLLPRLETKYSGLLASMILACVWGPWHIPIYWNSSLEYIIWFLVMIFALAVIFTWVYNRSHGNLLAVVLLHLMVNTTSLYLLGPTVRAYGMRPFQVVVGSLVCAAVVVVMSVGPNLCSNSLLEITPSGNRLPG